MTLDLYSYGRATRRAEASTARERALQSFLCTGCGCSATADDPALVRTIGWRILAGGRDDEREHAALCPRCCRRSVASRL